ncbi:MAG: DsbA family protein [Gemmatimonadetes bacterium]|nr:DsbA family protein [Gemmatimonadota bacterium]
MSPQAKRTTAPQGSSNKVLYLVLALVAVLGGGWIAYTVATGGGGGTAVAPVELTGIEDAQTLMAQAQGVTAGNTESRVQILVFSDFTCPACRGFSGLVEPQIKAEYVDAGKARLVYYDFPIGGPGHEHGFIAARAARCAAEQDRFWQYHAVLFARQPDWATQRSTPISTLLEYADLVGLDKGAFRSCLESDRFADIVTANKVLGERLGVRATPTVFIGNRAVEDWRDYAEVKEAIERELGNTTAAPGT